MSRYIDKKMKSEECINFLILWEKKVYDLINSETGEKKKFNKFSQSIRPENFKNRVPVLSLVKVSSEYQQLSPVKFKEIIKLSWNKPLIIKNSLISLKIMNID